MNTQRTVLEIGCGREPGPLFGDAVHYAVDSNERALELAAEQQHHPSLRLARADAANLDDVNDGFFDVILARNVFGDPRLGFPDYERIYSHVFEALGAYSPQGLEDIEESVAAEKMAILEEANRVLNKKGKLVVVEQYTPDVAKDFFDTRRGKLAGFVLSSRPLAEITPTNYADYHTTNRPDTVAWLGLKANDIAPSLDD